MTGGVPVWREFEHPRDLTDHERTALDAVVRRAGSDGVSAQATTAAVIAACACGCSSVRLVTAGAPLSTREMRRLEPEDRDDYAGIETKAYDSAGGQVAVTLHLLDGRLHELEFFTDEGVATSWPLTWS